MKKLLKRVFGIDEMEQALQATQAKLEELEQRLDRIEERSVTEFNRNSQMHVEMQHTIKELRGIIMNLLYSKGIKD